MTFDLTLSPLYRINGQEIASLPGLFVQLPPRNAARGREQDRLIVYLLLTGAGCGQCFLPNAAHADQRPADRR